MLPVIEIIRLEENIEGTFGVMKINKEVFCVTLERPDFENIQNISSIPAQQYCCVRVQSPKFGETFEITNVPNRTHVLFHAANTVDQLQGCVALAQYFGKLKGNRAVLNSGNTFKRFMEITKNYNNLHLTISEVF